MTVLKIFGFENRNFKKWSCDILERYCKLLLAMNLISVEGFVSGRDQKYLFFDTSNDAKLNEKSQCHCVFLKREPFEMKYKENSNPSCKNEKDLTNAFGPLLISGL